MAIPSKAYKPHNFESHNSLKLSFKNIPDCDSFLESNSSGILALCETNLDDLIYSGHFFVRDYLSLIRKDSSTHIHGLAVYMKEGLPFAWDLPLENSADSDLCFRLALFLSVFYFFFLYQSLLVSLCTVFDFISSNIDFLSINPYANIDWLNYSGGTDRSVELRHNFSVSNNLTQMVIFSTGIPDSDSHSPALLDLFLLTLVFVLQWLSLHCEILIMFLSELPLTFHHIHNRMSHFITLLTTILVVIGTVFIII